MAAAHILQTRSAEYAVLQAALPGQPPQDVGVVLLYEGELHIRLRRDWLEIADPAESEFLFALQEDLEQKASEMGGEALLAWLEDNLSNTLRITDRERTLADKPYSTLNRLYKKHIAPAVLRYETHLPVYDLRATGGTFEDERQVLAEILEWEEMPPDLRVSDKLFLAQVSGKSMEPLIPDGSYNIFRHGVAGSRENRIVLVELLTESGETSEYTVKRYRSQKQIGEDTFQHTRIWLEPENPAFKPIELGEDRPFRVVAEWIRVLEE